MGRGETHMHLHFLWASPIRKGVGATWYPDAENTIALTKCLQDIWRGYRNNLFRCDAASPRTRWAGAGGLTSSPR